MPIIKSNFKTQKFMHNGHFQTMYPYLFRKVKDVQCKRHRLELEDGDFLDLDISDIGSKELIILSHGLEGSSDTPYIKGMTKHFTKNENKDVIAWNMRSCSGELNRKEKFYHGAQIEDLQSVINFSSQRKNYRRITLVGFSLGGNLTAYYLATMGSLVPSNIDSAVIFSAPFDLKSCIIKLQSTSFGQLYAQNFLKTMKQKVYQKFNKSMFQHINIQKIKKVSSFLDFDRLITAPLAGYDNLDEYYNNVSAAKLIHKIKIPTLIVQAKDDPFLAKTSYPYLAARRNKNIYLEMTPSGGHIGFFSFDQGIEFWAERRASEFIHQIANSTQPLS